MRIREATRTKDYYNDTGAQVMRITYTIIPRYQCPTCGETRTGLLEVTGLFNQKLMCWACGAVALLKDCQPKKGQADHQGNNNAKPL